MSGIIFIIEDNPVYTKTWEKLIQSSYADFLKGVIVIEIIDFWGATK